MMFVHANVPKGGKEKNAPLKRHAISLVKIL